MDQNIQNINSFDKAIFEKISTIDSPLKEGSWESFSKMLDVELPNTIESNFDSTIKKALNTSVAASANLSGWDALSRMMDNDPILGNTPENVADHAVRSKLNYNEPNYNPQHWEILSDRLDTLEDRKVKVVLFKAIELALVLVVLLTSFSYYKPTNLFDTHSDPQNPSINQPKKLDFKTDRANKNIPMASVNDQNAFGNGYESANSDILPPSSFNWSQASSCSLNANNSNVERAALPNQVPNIPFITAGLLESNIKTLDIQQENANRPILPILISNKLAYFRVGVQSKLDLNNISTPTDNLTNETAYNRNVWGYGAGVTVAYGKGNWEVESGLNYSKKKYQANATVLQNNNPRANYESYAIKSVNMDVVEVPVNVRYTFAKKGKLKFYGNAGVSANIALTNNYVRDEFYPIIDPLQPRIAATNLIKGGLINNESLNKNLYITTNVGAGMEYAVTNKHNIFVQAAYQQYLNDKGLGPKNDKISTLAINAGARITL